MRKFMMSACCLAALGAAALFGATPSTAQEYPWCAQYGSNSGGKNCGFVTYRQCLAAVSGNGGYCTENHFYRGPVAGYVTERYVVRRPVYAYPHPY